MKRQSRLVVVALLTLVSPFFAQAQQNKKQGTETTAQTNVSSGGNKALKDKIVALEKQVWEAFKKKDANAFSALLIDDFVYVGPEGVIAGKPATMEANQAQFTAKTPLDYSIRDFKVVELTKDAALITFTHGTPPSDYRSTVWVRHGGKWLAAFHQRSPIEQEKTTK